LKINKITRDTILMYVSFLWKIGLICLNLLYSFIKRRHNQ